MGLRCYTEGGVIVELLDGWSHKVTHVQLLLGMQAHVENVQLKCRDAKGQEWHISVGLLVLESDLLRLLNPVS